MTPTKNEATLASLIDWFAEESDWARVAFKEAKDAGRTVIGVYCGFMPSELIRAAGAIPVSLCGNSAEAMLAAEVDLPRAFCPLIKSSYGLAITDTCPFFHFSDALIGETTCDGKKKMFELLKEYKPVHVMQLPFSGAAADEPALSWWLGEVKRVATFVEEVTGTTITDEALRATIRTTNEISDLLRQVASYFAEDDPPMTWTQMLIVQDLGCFVVETDEYAERLRELVFVLEAIAAERRAAPRTRGRRPRLTVTGTPMSPDTNKVMRIAEEAGADVVCHDGCSGVKMHDRRIDETGDPYEALARYTLGIPCACMSPNRGRTELLHRTVDTYRVEGVIDTVWQCCHTFNVESVEVGRYTRDVLGLPYLKLETDYSESDLGQLRTRIEAFVEQML
ncbi:MAG: 2-hydroxyacyl-CoA dehydratase [Aeromicrobium sp.]|nr:2-hydroxyacyl-CoA dehydratase [Aeromicrobium sp.]